ncbi:hypothetical protein AC624_09630 [Bacillus sp. FJAT-27238]|nr:hypothetical protein AC624_09630 [Bacillus sp. FJAT-27238]
MKMYKGNINYSSYYDLNTSDYSLDEIRLIFKEECSHGKINEIEERIYSYEHALRDDIRD